jgi:AcrR family transcriptional regulator
MSPRSKQLSEAMRAQSLDALIKAARKLFAEQGYFNCKVSDIAREAGMSQGNVYWYFASKEELLKAVLADGFETLGKVMTDAAQQPSGSIGKLDALLDSLYSFVQERGEFNTIMLSLLGHGGDSLFLELGFDMPRIGADYTRSVASIIVQGQAEGAISDRFDSITLTMFFFAFFNGLNLTYGQEWLALPRDSVRSVVQRLVAAQPDTTTGEGGT